MNAELDEVIHQLQEREPEAVVIGASAGGIEALMELLPAIQPGARFATLVVIHLPPEGPNLLPELLASQCHVPVKEAESGEPILPARIYIAPPDYHLSVESDGTLSLSTEAPVFYSRPSIDVLFESAARAWRECVVGVVLTGANADGARGLKRIIELGGIGLVEDPASAQYAAMPQAAITQALPQFTLPLAALEKALGGLSRSDTVQRTEG